MLKWLFGVLLAVNVIFFAAMKWGAWLTTDLENPTVKAELNADKVLLLSDSPAAVVAPPAVPVTAAPPLKSAMPAELNKVVCYQWGEFVAAEIERAQKLLTSAKLPNKIDQHEVVRANGYWVYIGPLKTPEMVKLNSLQLKMLGISDFYVLADEGAWKNTISLGVYKTEAAAKSYLSRLNVKGVQNALAGVREQKENEATFVLGPLAPTAVNKLAALRADFPNRQLKEISCAAK